MNLWLPDQGKKDDRTGFCRLCRTRLRPGEAVHHITRCYRQQEAEVRSQSPRERAPELLGDHNVDTEFLDFHRRRRDAA